MLKKNYLGLAEGEWKKRYYDPERSFKANNIRIRGNNFQVICGI